MVHALTELGCENVVAKSRTNRVELMHDPCVVPFEVIEKELKELDFRVIPPKTVDGCGPDC